MQYLIVNIKCPDMYLRRLIRILESIRIRMRFLKVVHKEMRLQGAGEAQVGHISEGAMSL